MSDLDHLTQEQLASRAEALLRDPMLVQALHTIEDEAIRSIKDSAEPDTSIREIAYYKIKAVRDLHEALHEHVVNFKIASRK